MNNFSNLGLSTKLVEVLDKMGFTDPTPVQAKAIPTLLNENPTDFIGLAQTGTGKTAAFGLPLLDLIDPKQGHIQGLILAPTRELAQQTYDQLDQFSSGSDVSITVVYGGASIENQIKRLKKKTHIVVATPGRLIDLVKRKSIKLNDIKHVVLDEADEMLNMGFKEDIDQILSFSNLDRSIWLFSATMPGEIKRIVKTYMTDPVEVSVNQGQKSNKDISHKYVITKTANKLAAIRRFLDILPEMRGIMFCRTKRETQQIADDLGDMGYQVEALHGDLSQAQRDAVMKRFKSRSMQLLIATDVAARGIDVNDLTHVLHHSLPDQLESYTHRSGRTGRAGKKGTSLVLINPREGKRISALEKKLDVSFEKIDIPTLDDIKVSRVNNWAKLIVNTEVDPKSDDILNSMEEEFAHLSKTDILKRLITTQLDHLMVSGKEEDDLNETHGGSPEKRDSSKFHRYFINVGSIDGVTKSDLLHFLSDIAQVKRKFFGDITLKKNCAFFDIDGTRDKGLDQKFDGIEVNGRDIKVKRDEESQPRTSRPERELRRKPHSEIRKRKKKTSKGNQRPQGKGRRVKRK